MDNMEVIFRGILWESGCHLVHPFRERKRYSAISSFQNKPFKVSRGLQFHLEMSRENQELPSFTITDERIQNQCGEERTF